jgi:hypothetical protein
MNQSFFYLNHDPVNEHCLRRWVEERGGTLCPLSLRDPLPDGDSRLLLIDWDSLDLDGREEYLAGLLAQPDGRRVGLHSSYLPDAETMRRKGVAVFARLDPDATTCLADRVRQYFPRRVPLCPRSGLFHSARISAGQKPS